MNKIEMWICPHCDKHLDDEMDVHLLARFMNLNEVAELGLIVLDKMGRNWHTKCWEEFKAEYNDVLDANDLKED